MNKKWQMAASTVLSVALALLSTPALAATRLDIPGGWYADNTPGGAYVALVKDSHVQTHTGNVPLPSGGNLLYVRLAADGRRFAGVGGADDHVYEWDGGWHDRGMGFGVNAVIYDVRDVLRIVWGAGTPTGSQGWRYMADDGHLVTGDESYANPALHLWEYTIRGDISCGQGGDEEGLQCLVRGRRVLVEPGIVRFIRFSRSGENLALAWVRQDTRSAGLVWLTASELDGLPTYTVPGTTPPVEPPQPVPEPVPEPPPATVECGQIPALGQTLLRQLAERFADEIRSSDDEQRRAWALRAAQQLAFSVSPSYGSKRASEGRPQTKDGVAKFVNGRLCSWDLVNGNSRELQFHNGEDITGQVFIPVTPVNHLGTVPDPPDPPADCAALEARIVELEREVAQTITDKHIAVQRLEGELAAALRERDEARAERDELKNRPEPRCTASIFGIKLPCKVIR